MGCCKTCCGCISSGLVKLTAGTIFLSGLGITGYGLYLLTKHTAGITIFVLSVGAYLILSGAVGLRLSCKAAPFYTTRLYVVLLMLGFLVQASVAVALKVDQSWAEKSFDKHACSGQDADCSETDKWIDSHIDRIFWVLVFSAGAEFVASVLACCYSSTHTEEDCCEDEDEYGSRYSSLRQSGLGMESNEPLTREVHAPISSSPNKSYVDSLREKYNIPARNSSSNV